MQIYDCGSGCGSKKGYRLGTDSGTSEDEFFGTSSPLLPRHRLCSFNENGVDTEQMSPDSSPNGSLRRRRSKGMLDDQGNLMDFLRNSCDSRERKSWGSLGDSSHYKDKSAWRKSTLNVSNSTEEIRENLRRDIV
uniref:Uncharacterized protein n=1 Tax=Dendroctonus ponderosae TaxID=77166 RepID=A0AAR5P2D8_DENPD